MNFFFRGITDNRLVILRMSRRHLIPQEAKDEIAEVFELFDADKSGCIDRQELYVGIRAMGFNVTQQDIEAIFREKDVENLGYLVFKQFREVIGQKLQERKPEEEFKQVFALFDKEHTGRIGIREIKRVCMELGKTDLTDDDMNAMIRQFDTDGDGFITQAAFVRMMEGDF